MMLFARAFANISILSIFFRSLDDVVLDVLAIASQSFLFYFRETREIEFPSRTWNS